MEDVDSYPKCPGLCFRTFTFTLVSGMDITLSKTKNGSIEIREQLIFRVEDSLLTKMVLCVTKVI